MKFLEKELREIVCAKLVKSRVHVNRVSIRGILFALIFSGVGNYSWAEDQIGAFFDENMGTNMYSTTTQDQIVSFYVTIVEPSSDSGIKSLLCTLDFVGSTVWGVEPYNGYWLGWLPFPTLWVSCDPPATGDSYVVMAQYNVLVESPSHRVDIYLSNSFGASYSSPDDIVEIQLSPISGDNLIPLATINGAVASDAVSWGGVKALYR